VVVKVIAENPTPRMSRSVLARVFGEVVGLTTMPLVKVKAFGTVRVPPLGTLRTIGRGPPATCGGMVPTQVVLLPEVLVAVVPPMVTTGGVPRFVPTMVTVPPPCAGEVAGVTEVTVGVRPTV
jgi:hypothetical protein